MRRVILLCGFLSVWILGVAAGGEGETGLGAPILTTNHQTGVTTVAPNLDLTTDDTASVRSLIEYDLSLRIAGEYFQILEDYEDQIWIEAHTGVVAEIRFDNQRGHIGPILGLRINVIQPRLLAPGSQLARIHKLNAMVYEYGRVFGPEATARINSIEDELIEYNRNRLFKRVGVGIGFPYVVTSEGRANFPDVGSEYLADYFLFDRWYLLVALDPTDYVSLHAGVHHRLESAFVGITVDISSPVRAAFKGASDWIVRLTGAS